MIKDKFIRRLLILMAIIIGIWFLWAVRSIILYMAIAAVVTLMASPAVNLLGKIHIGHLRIPNTISVIIVMLVMGLAIVGVLSLVIPLVAHQAENLSLLDAAKAKENAIIVWQNFITILKNYGVVKKTDFLSPDFIKDMDFSFIPNFINTIISSIGAVVTLLFSVVFFAFFFLKERGRASSFILSLVPDAAEKKVSDMMTKTGNLLSRYVIGLFIQQFIIFCFTLTLLLIFGVNNPFIIAFLVALLNIIPYIGPCMGGVLIVSFTMLSTLGSEYMHMMPLTLWVLLGFIAIQLFDNFISQPLIFSSSVKAHPLEIFTVTLIGGTLFGILGMIVAVPTYTLLRIVAKEFFWESKIVRVFTKNI